MLQIIGWILCALLALGSLHMAFSRDLRSADGTLRDGVQYSVIFGLACAAVFAFMLWAQGTAMQNAGYAAETNALEFRADCMEEALDAGIDPLSC